MILELADLPDVFMEVLDVFLVHLLLGLLELVHPDDLVVADLLGNLTDQLGQLVGLLYGQEDLSLLPKAPELLTALLEFFHKETKFPEIELRETVLQTCLNSRVQSIKESFHLVAILTRVDQEYH
jgi:hypothetical protein